jgi:hypothetical protein
MRQWLARWWPPLIVAGAVVLAFAVQPASSLAALVGPVLIVAAALVVLFIAFLRGIARRRDQRSITLLRVCLAACLLAGLVVYRGAPLRLRLRLSQEELHEAAMLTVQGRTPDTPSRIGWFNTQKITIDGGIVRFSTTLDEWSEDGIAFFPVPLDDEQVDGYTYFPIGFHRGVWFIYSRNDGGT